MNETQKRKLVLELMAQDIQAALIIAVGEKRQELVGFVEGLWDKYRVTLTGLRKDRSRFELELDQILRTMRYV
jgi:hypothetical protein